MNAPKKRVNRRAAVLQDDPQYLCRYVELPVDQSGAQESAKAYFRLLGYRENGRFGHLQQDAKKMMKNAVIVLIVSFFLFSPPARAAAGGHSARQSAHSAPQSHRDREIPEHVKNTLCRPLEDRWYEDKERGWFFNEFCEERSLDDPDRDEQQTAQNPEPSPGDHFDWEKLADRKYLDTLSTEEFRNLFEDVRNEVIHRPDYRKMFTYLTMQDYMKDKSLTFAYLWRDVLLEHPELDPNTRTPGTSFGTRVKEKVDIARKRDFMEALSQKAGLFFFVSGDCPYCHYQAQVLNILVERYGIEVRTISSDHCEYEGFVSCTVEPRLFGVFGVKMTPSLIAVYRDEDERPVFQPIANGLVTADIIINRLMFYYDYRLNGAYPS
jgi:conjugal transfer pilus assembly protein TraF